jgi:hypothetical protein
MTTSWIAGLRTLALEAVGALPLGSDFPVEYVSPWLGFYAAITRSAQPTVVLGLSSPSMLGGITQNATSGAVVNQPGKMQTEILPAVGCPSTAPAPVELTRLSSIEHAHAFQYMNIMPAAISRYERGM